MKKIKLIFFLLGLSSCSSNLLVRHNQNSEGAVDVQTKDQIAAAHTVESSLRFEYIQDYRLTNNIFQNTVAGSLSGIVKVEDHFFAVSNDRGSERGEPRFYKLLLENSRLVINQVYFFSKPTSLDFEGITHSQGRLYISTEGAYKQTPLVNPSVFSFNINTSSNIISETKSLALPFEYLPNINGPQTFGIQHNLGFEGLTQFDESIYVATESALKQDSETQPNLSRVLKYNNEKLVGEWLYPVESSSSLPGVERSGVSEIMAIGLDRLWVMEKAKKIGRKRDYSVRIYEVYLESQSSVISEDKSQLLTLTKKLILDLDSMVDGFTTSSKVSNFEGMTWVVPNQKLLLMSDDNFSEKEPTHFLELQVSGL